MISDWRTWRRAIVGGVPMVMVGVLVAFMDVPFVGLLGILFVYLLGLINGFVQSSWNARNWKGVMRRRSADQKATIEEQQGRLDA